MTINLFQTPEYRALMREHILKTITYLFEKEQEFALACEIKYLDFNPPLPKEIMDTFQDTVLFILSGYTFETATINEHILTFEAGFGSDNFGSHVTVPLLAIRQIFIGENPIVLNLAFPEEKPAKNKTTSMKKTQKMKKSSMEALLSNPENKKLLKKKR